jgi:hypothetical protein
MKYLNLEHEVIMRGIKMIDIIYITILYSTFSILFSVCVDYYSREFNEEKYNESSTLHIILEIWFSIGVIAVGAYLIKNFIQKIPFPLDGVWGFVHANVKELAGGPIYGFLLFFYQYKLRSKIEYILKRLKG